MDECSLCLIVFGNNSGQMLRGNNCNCSLKLIILLIIALNFLERETTGELHSSRTYESSLKYRDCGWRNNLEIKEYLGKMP